jgi:hypothetical protein
MLPVMVHDQGVLLRLRQFALDRERLAATAGIATIDYRQRLQEIEAAVNRSRDEQRAYGEQILRTLGIDPASAEYRIDEQTGLVRELVDGQWQEVRR